MAELALTNCKIYMGGYDLSGYHNEVELNSGAEVLDKTQFGNTARTRHPGLLNIEANGKGFWQAGTGLPDTVIEPLVGTANQVLTVCPTTGAAGEVSYTQQGVIGDFGFGASIGEMLTYTWAAYGEGARLVRGTMVATGAKTSTGSGTAYNLGAVTATKTLFASLHVTAVSGTDTPTITVKIQSDDAQGFASATDRITFAAKTAVGAEWATPVTSAITDTWWRAYWTVSGTDPSLTIHVTVGILDDL